MIGALFIPAIIPYLSNRLRAYHRTSGNWRTRTLCSSTETIAPASRSPSHIVTTRSTKAASCAPRSPSIRTRTTDGDDAFDSASVVNWRKTRTPSVDRSSALAHNPKVVGSNPTRATRTSPARSPCAASACASSVSCKTMATLSEGENPAWDARSSSAHKRDLTMVHPARARALAFASSSTCTI